MVKLTSNNTMSTTILFTISILIFMLTCTQYSNHHYCEASRVLSHHNRSIHIMNKGMRTFPLIDDEKDDDDDESDDEDENNYIENALGIHGLAYDHKERVFYALPHTSIVEAKKRKHTNTRKRRLRNDDFDDVDDEEDGYYPPRILTITIGHAEQANVEETTILRDTHGNEYEPGDFEPTSIAYDPRYQTYFIAQEERSRLHSDGIFIYDYYGTQMGQLDIPDLFTSGKLIGMSLQGEGGVPEQYNDKGATTILYCYFAMDNGTSYQIILIDVENHTVKKRYIYETQGNDHHLASIVAINEEHLLTLERVGDQYPYTTNIYYASSTDESRRVVEATEDNSDSHSNIEGKVMTRSLLTSLDDTTNYESMAIKHAGGEEQLNRYELVLIDNKPFVQKAEDEESVNQNSTEISVLRVWYHHDHSFNFKKSTDFFNQEPDELCKTFCDGYWKACSKHNFFHEQHLHNYEVERKLNAFTAYQIFNAKTDGENMLLQTSSVLGSMDSESYDECLGECMAYPRPPNPLEYEIPDRLGVNLGGDTFWCRMRYLTLAQTENPNDAALYCPQASPTGGGICYDSTIDDGLSPYNLYNLAVNDDDRRRDKYCEFLADDTIADCTSAGIDDNNLQTALSLIPNTVHTLILNDNRGITKLLNGTFDSLSCQECILSLLIEEASITYIELGVFDKLIFLQVLNLNQNLVEDIPMGLLDFNPYLKQFSMFQGPNKPGMLTSLPNDLFGFNWEIERIIFDGHPDLNYLPNGLFDGLYECEIISFKRCGIINAGIPDGIFDDLMSLLYFDFSTNYITTAKASWFEKGWGEYVTRVALNENLIETIEDGIFDTLISLENVYLHDNNITNVPTDLFHKNHELVVSTL